MSNIKIIESLRKSANSLIAQAVKKNTECSGNWTYRRQRFADNAQRDKDRLVKKAVCLNRLADLHESGDCPEILQKVRTASDLEAYYPRPINEDDHGWYREEYPAKLKKALKAGLKCLDDNDIFRKCIERLSEIRLSPEEEKQRELKAALVEVHKMNIQGFFPTPDDVIEKMIELSEIEDNEHILEPSAGIGSIVDVIKVKHHQTNIYCVEIMHSLREILKLKGYDLVCDDIFLYEPTGRLFDKIIMNPPFEKGQDIDHVMHCFNNFLKVGGTLVSVMSASIKSNTTRKYYDFRNFISLHGGEIHELEQAFKDAFNSTGVSTVIVKLHK